MSGDLIVRHHIPGEVVALKAEVVAELATLKSTLAEVDEVPDAETIKAVDVHLSAAAKMKRGIEKQRLEITRPLDKLKGAIKGRVDEALVPITAEVKRVAGLVGERKQILDREREEAEKRAREEAERLEREHREAVRKSEEEAKASAEEEARLFGGNPEPAPVNVPPPVVDVPMPVPAKVKSSVSVSMVRVVEILDDSLVPIEVGGVCVRPVDKVAIRRLMLAGVKVPGCELSKKPSTVVR